LRDVVLLFGERKEKNFKFVIVRVDARFCGVWLTLLTFSDVGMKRVLSHFPQRGFIAGLIFCLVLP